MKTLVLSQLCTCVVVAAGARTVSAWPTRLADDPAVKVVRDLAYYDGKDADPQKHKLDLYLPREKSAGSFAQSFPVLMFFHGGAWRTGDKAIYGKLGNAFAKEGFATACVSYRLSPGVQQPAHIEDVARAFAWVHANIAKHGGDPRRIFVSGHSAGGHLVALLTLNEKYLKAQGRSTKDVAGVIALSGVYRIRSNLFEAFGTQLENWKDASPLDSIRAGTPPGTGFRVRGSGFRKVNDRGALAVDLPEP